jgi:hypothetical protein
MVRWRYRAEQDQIVQISLVGTGALPGKPLTLRSRNTTSLVVAAGPEAWLTTVPLISSGVYR